MTELKLHDMIRSYDFGMKSQPDCYLTGVIVGFTGNFIEFAILKRVWEGKEEPVQHPEIGCCPMHGASMFDAFNPRIEFLKHAPPCFSLDESVTAALEAFRKARRF
jgi:hypothetical protein